jgi:hypothetical protein
MTFAKECFLKFRDLNINLLNTKNKFNFKTGKKFYF